MAFQKDAATHRSSFLDVPLKGLAFTERGFEKLPCDTDELIGVTFRDGTQIVEYLANVANTAILIESALMKAERPRDLVRIEFVFDPSQDFGLEVVKINARAYTLSARSPIAFATKALCTSTALDALYAIEGRDSVDPLLVWHLAEPLRFTDLAPAELKFDIHGGDRAAESAVETAAQIVRAAESLIRKTLSKVVQRPNIDPVAFTELPAALDLGPLRAAFA
ncbi:MAG: hypothetical protein ACO3P1_15650, partial [Pseudomonadales bacterium]